MKFYRLAITERYKHECAVLLCISMFIFPTEIQTNICLYPHSSRKSFIGDNIHLLMIEWYPKYLETTTVWMIHASFHVRHSSCFCLFQFFFQIFKSFWNLYFIYAMYNRNQFFSWMAIALTVVKMCNKLTWKNVLYSVSL